MQKTKNFLECCSCGAEILEDESNLKVVDRALFMGWKIIKGSVYCKECAREKKEKELEKFCKKIIVLKCDLCPSQIAEDENKLGIISDQQGWKKIGENNYCPKCFEENKDYFLLEER